MRVGIFHVHIMRIVGRDDLHIIFFRESQKHFIHLYLFRYSMILDFHIIIFAKQIQPPLENFFCFGFSFFQNRARNFCSNTASGCNQSFMILQNQFLINARIFSVTAFNVSKRAEFDKIFISFGILRQHQLMIAHVLNFFCELLFMSVFHHIKFTADNRLYLVRIVGSVMFGCFRHKTENTKHISVISNRDSRHIITYRFFIHLRNIRGSVKERILGVNV